LTILLPANENGIAGTGGHGRDYCTAGHRKLILGGLENRRMSMDILLIDDEASFRQTLRMRLEAMGHAVWEARNGSQAHELLDRQQFQVAFLDLRLAGEQGLALLPELLRMAPGLHIVIITAYATMETAVAATISARG
jgi:DNA-binding NtrC family response regulator